MSTERLPTRARVLSVDLVTGEMTFPRQLDEAPPYRAALVLARVHRYPIGFVHVPYDHSSGSSVLVERVREAAWEAYRDEIKTHLKGDGLASVSTAAELSDRETLHCALAAVPAPTSPLISVVIATLRNVDNLLECVRRVLQSSYPDFEVIVVNNDPQGGDVESRLTERFAGDERVHYVHQPLIGLSRARNKGLESVRGEIAVFTDDDVIVDMDWLTHIAGAFQARPDVSCATGAILPAELETPAQGWLEQYGGFNKGFGREIYNLTDHNRPEPLYPFDSGRFGSGANLAFSTDVIRALGGFAEDLGAGTPAHGGEDMDILLRVINAGHTLVYEPAALIWHLHRRPYSALRRQLFRYGVGLSATVTKWVFDGRPTTGQVLKRLLVGASHVLRPDSAKNRTKAADYPSQLTRLELVGLAVGPFAYVRSRRSARRT